MANYYEKMGETTFENLVNTVGGAPLTTGLRTILAGQGALKRGTALALNADKKLVILGTSSATANCVLAEDIDATAADVDACVYLTGHFNRNTLAVKASYTITAADVEAFRAAGIFLDNSVE